MSSGLGGLFNQQRSSGFSVIIGLALLAFGILTLNAQLAFLDIQLDTQNPTFQIIIGAVAALGGIVLLYHALRPHRSIYG